MISFLTYSNLNKLVIALLRAGGYNVLLTRYLRCGGEMTTNSPPPTLTPGQDDPHKGPKNGLVQWVQVAASIATAVAVIVAIWVATQGQVTVDRNARATLQQSEDDQLSTAITAIGSGDTSEEIAGLLLLARNTSNRFALMSETKETPADVFGDYTTALQILSGYLSSHGETYLTGTNPSLSATFGRGYGLPPSPGIPLDIIYAANQVEFLLSSGMTSSVASLDVGTLPAIDLSHDELVGQPWNGVNFAWIYAYLAGIDLRGADLEHSQWSPRSDLSGAYLQCADLAGANFRGANLSDANLSGADVQGADFSGADLRGAVLTSMYGVAKWPQQTGEATFSTDEWNQGACLQDKSFWRGQPAAGSSTPPSA